MEAPFFTRHPFAKDAITLIIFVVCVIIGTVLINTFVFRSFNVVGASMEPTMHEGDRLIVNRMAVTWENILGESYVPNRGQVIIFENPNFVSGREDQFVVKRVIAFPGERVVLQNGTFTVYNAQFPTGFNPDANREGKPLAPASGEVDMVVPTGELFVAGDNREGGFSHDSRNGLGTIPYYEVVGPVAFRIFPFTQMKPF